MTKTEKTYHSNGQIKTVCSLVNGKKHGEFIRYFENGQIAIVSNYSHGKSHGLWKEYYENGQIAEEGEYINGDYNVINFWIESGEQLLVNGSGKTIRKYGASQGDIYEQYFENGQYIGEKKIAEVIYGKFIPDTEK